MSTSSFFSTNNRWVLTLIAQLGIYGGIAVSAMNGKSKNASAENRAAGVWLNPSMNGYRVISGDPTSPSLWNPTDYMEIILLSLFFGSLILTYYLLRKKESKDPIWLSIIKTIVIWSNTGLLLFLLPVNAFHKRFLYNFKVFLAEMLAEPAKELFLAFTFIVLFPLPGSETASVTERYTWLAAKMGIFYIFQTLLLGSPTYTVKQEGLEPLIFMSKKQSGYYALIIAGTILALLIEKYALQKIIPNSK